MAEAKGLHGPPKIVSITEKKTMLLFLDGDAVLRWSKAKTAKQLNFEAEIMPLLVALTCWPDRLKDCLLLVFIDNDAARHAWVSATAKTKHARNMIHSALSLEAQLGIVSSTHAFQHSGCTFAIGFQVVPGNRS